MTLRTPIYQGRIVDLGIEEATLPDGRRLTLEVVRHPGGAAAVALDDNRRVCLIRQYRHAAGGWIWEVPAGKLEPGEPPAETARRELEEEAGVIATAWSPLGSILSTPGFCTERIYLFLARDLAPTATRHEHQELIEIHWVELERALAWVNDGTIDDAKTVTALFRAATLLAGR